MLRVSHRPKTNLSVPYHSPLLLCIDKTTGTGIVVITAVTKRIILVPPLLYNKIAVLSIYLQYNGVFAWGVLRFAQRALDFFVKFDENEVCKPNYDLLKGLLKTAFKKLIFLYSGRFYIKKDSEWSPFEFRVMMLYAQL